MILYQDRSPYFNAATRLDGMVVKRDQDPDVCMTAVHHIGEVVPEQRLLDIVLEGLTKEYIMIKYNAEREPNSTLDEVETTMRNMYANRVARGGSSRKFRGREPAMVASSSTTFN